LSLSSLLTLVLKLLRFSACFPLLSTVVPCPFGAPSSKTMGSLLVDYPRFFLPFPSPIQFKLGVSLIMTVTLVWSASNPIISTPRQPANGQYSSPYPFFSSRLRPGSFSTTSFLSFPASCMLFSLRALRRYGVLRSPPPFCRRFPLIEPKTSAPNPHHQWLNFLIAFFSLQLCQKLPCFLKFLPQRLLGPPFLFHAVFCVHHLLRRILVLNGLHCLEASTVVPLSPFPPSPLFQWHIAGQVLRFPYLPLPLNHLFFYRIPLFCDFVSIFTLVVVEIRL